MKKLGIFLMHLMAIVIRSHYDFAQSATITLMPGWNWISVPLMDTLDFETALGSFTPMPGDIIKSQWSNATYMSNGQWRGPISQFYPGYGYMYYSNRVMPVMLTFNAQQPAPQVIVTTAEPTDITINSATCGGCVTSSNGDYVSVTLRGICWGTNPNPTFNDNYVESGNGLGDFTISMTELTLSTTYYVRAFAVTAIGTFYGEELNFTTPDDVHDYVDLGLPSGLLWATCNVGANTPDGYGDYFAWGETQPKDEYSLSTYQYYNKYCGNPNSGYNGFTDDLNILEPMDDAATANWGNNWRTPTKEEWQELYDNTTRIMTIQNGMIGGLFTASNGNSLFLPLAGERYGTDLYNFGSDGSYWSSSFIRFDPEFPWSFIVNFGLDTIESRTAGLPVRPVRSAPQN